MVNKATMNKWAVCIKPYQFHEFYVTVFGGFVTINFFSHHLVLSMVIQPTSAVYGNGHVVDRMELPGVSMAFEKFKELLS